MDKNEKQIIDNTILFVKETLKDSEGGHDWFHIERVYNNSITIAQSENVNTFIVALGALLHDIADAKFYKGDETVGPKMARDFLKTQNVSEKVIEEIQYIINNISFKNSLDKSESFPFTIELKVIQDADRLDAIGAIGIARAFNYGGFKNRVLFDPEIEPKLNQTKEEYKKSKAPTINHFYEKLFLLKDKMNTKTGKKIALERHNYMQDFVKQFYKEWGI
jgi:uncharacterized protein